MRDEFICQAFSSLVLINKYQIGSIRISPGQLFYYAVFFTDLPAGKLRPAPPSMRDASTSASASESRRSFRQQARGRVDADVEQGGDADARTGPAIRYLIRRLWSIFPLDLPSFTWFHLVLAFLIHFCFVLSWLHLVYTVNVSEQVKEVYL